MTMYDTCPVCGHLTSDPELSKSWHQSQGESVDLSQLSGHNDVPPLPEREQ
jgi:hypothetical protein